MLFKEVLAEKGYMPFDTKLTVVGTVSDMCVLTSAVNALSEGFEVQVYVPGINAGSAAPDPQWTQCTSDGTPGPIGGEECCVPLPSLIREQPNAYPNWQKLVYQCQWASGIANALEYMQMAGAELLWTLP